MILEYPSRSEQEDRENDEERKNTPVGPLAGRITGYFAYAQFILYFNGKVGERANKIKKN